MKERTTVSKEPKFAGMASPKNQLIQKAGLGMLKRFSKYRGEKNKRNDVDKVSDVARKGRIKITVSMTPNSEISAFKPETLSIKECQDNKVRTIFIKFHKILQSDVIVIYYIYEKVICEVVST